MGIASPLTTHRLLPPPMRTFSASLPLLSPSFLSLRSTSRALVSLIVHAESETGSGRGSADGSSSTSASPTNSNLSSPAIVETAAGKGGGFGNAAVAKKKKRGKEKKSVIRRSPIQNPSIRNQVSGGGAGGRSGGSSSTEQEQQSLNENAFLLTWLGLGSLILVEGIALAASGFLPEQWDNLFVKYLYPSFTPTVFLFVGGTVAYGVIKYLQGEQLKK